VFLIGFPLLIVPFALYNMMTFLLGIAWPQELATFRLASGADWSLTWDELLVTIAGLMLFFEMLKARRLSARSVVDHALSMLLFAGMAAEFLLVKQAASGTFFLLLVISFVDVAGGFTMTMHTAQRDMPIDHDISIEKADSVPAAAVGNVPATEPVGVPAPEPAGVPAPEPIGVPAPEPASVPATAAGNVAVREPVGLPATEPAGVSATAPATT
jgi:hypothetical protein